MRALVPRPAPTYPSPLPRACALTVAGFASRGYCPVLLDFHFNAVRPLCPHPRVSFLYR